MAPARMKVADYKERIRLLELALMPAVEAVERAERVNPTIHNSGTVLMRVSDLRAARDVMAGVTPQPWVAPAAREVPEPRLPVRIGQVGQGPRKAYRFFRSEVGALSQEGDGRIALLAKCICDQQLNGFADQIDLRQAACPVCDAPGFNSGWGYWRFLCGASVNPQDGSFVAACPADPG